MNKNINFTGCNSPNRRWSPQRRSTRHSQLMFQNERHPQVGRLSTQSYLWAKIAYSSSQQKHGHHNYSYPLGEKRVELNNLQEKKIIYRKKKKQLVIQECQNEGRQRNSLGITLQKRRAEVSEGKFMSFSSEKKTPIIRQSFKLCNPPKWYQKVLRSREIEDKCELIQTILRRYKDQVNTTEASDYCDSPYISSLKLKERSLEQTDYSGSRKREHLKFFGKRGCPPNKLEKQLMEKRQKKDGRGGVSGVMGCQQKAGQGCLEEISPWRTQQA